MAKASEIQDLDCGASASEGLLKVLLTRGDEVVKFGTLALENGENADVIHDLRVSIRRLRSALRDFSEFMNKKALKPIRRKLKLLAYMLGAVRDRDVVCDALEKLKHKTEEESLIQGIDKLITEQMEIRAQAFDFFLQNFKPQLKELQSVFPEIIIASTGRIGFSFGHLGKIVITENLEAFLRSSTSLYNPFDVESLHELRIAGKRLRYSIETFSICDQQEVAENVASKIAEMQSALGELHDADVWIQGLKNRLADERIDKKLGLWLMSEFVKKRTQSYREAIRLWSNWIESNFLENLKEYVETFSRYE